MSKEKSAPKSDKKKAGKSLLEKRADKKAKKSNKNTIVIK
jgi:hypothetical protein